jgi:hypothetical protein
LEGLVLIRKLFFPTVQDAVTIKKERRMTGAFMLMMFDGCHINGIHQNIDLQTYLCASYS